MDYEAIKSGVTEHFTCDPDTGFVYRRIKSNRRQAGEQIGHRMQNGYIALTIPVIRVKVYCHHVVYFLCTGRWGPEHGIQIDHRDCCRSNNRLDNLREASASLNAVNSHRGYGSTPYKTRDGIRYRSQLMVSGNRYVQGGFLTPEEAREWYLSEKRLRSTQFFGEVVGT